MNRKRGLLVLSACAVMFAVVAGAKANQLADPVLGKLKRQTPAHARPIAMVDTPGRPRGAGTPPRRRSTTIGTRISTDDSAPPAKKRNVLNWHGYPKNLTAPVGRIWAIPAGERRFRPVCSGTVVARGLVVTAAHCVTDGNGRYSKDILFVPGQTWNDPDSTAVDDIKAPWGVWQAHQWFAPDVYRNGTVDLDWGLIEMKPKNGDYIGDVVGSYRIQTGIRFLDRAQIWSMGYPGSGKWRRREGLVGRGQYACQTTWRGGAWRNYARGYELWIKCPMNGGASGGPWIVQLASREWVIGGVNNWCNDDVKGDDQETYCTPVSTDLRSLVFDQRFVAFWRSVLPQLDF
jgi:trypsin-like peptidase